MAYRKPFSRISRTLDELAGYEKFTDKQGREWGIKVYPLGELYKVSSLLDTFAKSGGSYKAQTAFVAAMLIDPCPDWFIRARRLLGLPDYSCKSMGKTFYHVDVMPAVNAVCKANYDMTFDELIERALKTAKEREEQKKK